MNKSQILKLFFYLAFATAIYIFFVDCLHLRLGHINIIISLCLAYGIVAACYAITNHCAKKRLEEETQKLTAQFGPIESQGLHLTRRFSQKGVDELLNELAKKACQSELKAAIRYIALDQLSLDILFESFEDSSEVYSFDDQVEKFFFFISLAVQDYKQEPLSQKLKLISKINNQLEMNSSSRVIMKKHQTMLETIYCLVHDNILQYEDLKQLMWHIDGLVCGAYGSYGHLVDKCFRQELFATLRYRLLLLLKDQNNKGKDSSVDFVKLLLDKWYQQYMGNYLVSYIQNNCSSRLIGYEEVARQIFKSKETILSISDLKNAHRCKPFIEWFPHLVKTTKLFIDKKHSADYIFNICYSQYQFICVCGDERPTPEAIGLLRNKLPSKIEEDDEHYRIASSTPDDQNDLPYLNMKHPFKSLNDCDSFDYNIAIRNVNNFSKAKRIGEEDNILVFFPYVKLLRGKRIKSFNSIEGPSLYVELENQTRKKGFMYKSKKLQKGERSLISSLDFVPSKEGVWEFLIIITYYSSDIITSKQSLEEKLSQHIYEGLHSYDLTGYDFIPVISESQNHYYVHFVEWSQRGLFYYLSDSSCCIGKGMPHSVQFTTLKTQKVAGGVLYS